MSTRVPWVEVPAPAGLAIIRSMGTPVVMKVTHISYGRDVKQPLGVSLNGFDARNDELNMNGFQMGPDNQACPILEPFREKDGLPVTLFTIPNKVVPRDYCTHCNGINIPTQCSFSVAGTTRSEGRMTEGYPMGVNRAAAARR